MVKKMLKDGRCVITEYEVREIDAHGDAIEVHCFETPEEAKRFAERLLGGDTVAVVVEKHISKHPHFRFAEPDVYKTLVTMGSADALRKGSWI